jgi:hypothetical protein
MEDVVVPKHTVIQYVRHKGGKNKRVPYGVIVAVKNDDGFNVAYSLCNKKDRFSKTMALKVALGRTKTRHSYFDHEAIACCWGGPAPRDVNKMLDAFVERCKKYYKVSVY